MDVQLFGNIASFHEIPTGGLFWYGSQGRTQLGLKVRNEGAEAFAVLDSREAPDVRRIFAPNLLDNTTLLALPGAIVRASRNPNDWDLGHRDYGVGDLVLANGKVLLVANGEPGAWILVDFDKGELSNGRIVSAVIKRWSIVQMIDGRPETLFEHWPDAATNRR